MSKAENITPVGASTSEWGRLAANSTAHMTEHLFNGVVAVVLPIITASLGLTLAQAGTLASARTLLAGIASFPSGFLADLARRRNVLLGLCVALIGFSSFGLSLAYSFPVLLIFMGLGGFGGGWFHPQSLAILSNRYRERRAFALGIHDSSANLGEVVGPLTIGLLLQFFDWRTTLQIWALPGITIGILYVLFGAEGDVSSGRPRDYKRALWNDVLSNRAVCGLVAVSTLRAMGQTALAAFLPLYLALHLKLSAGVVGAYMSVLFLLAGIAPAFVGWISDRIGRKPLIISFSMLSVAIILVIPYISSPFILPVALGALGAFLWALRPVIVSASMEAAPQHMAGSIVAFIFGANMSVSFLAPILAGVIADTYGLPVALSSIALFPLLASLVTLAVIKPAQA